MGRPVLDDRSRHGDKTARSPAAATRAGRAAHVVAELLAGQRRAALVAGAAALPIALWEAFLFHWFGVVALPAAALTVLAVGLLVRNRASLGGWLLLLFAACALRLPPDV